MWHFCTVLLQIHSSNCLQKTGILDLSLIKVLQNEQGCNFFASQCLVILVFSYRNTKMTSTKNAAAIAPSGEWFWRIPTPRTCLTHHCGWTPCDINVTYTSLKSAFNGLQFRHWQYRSIFISLAVIASETQEMSRNSKRNPREFYFTAVQGHPR